MSEMETRLDRECLLLSLHLPSQTGGVASEFAFRTAVHEDLPWGEDESTEAGEDTDNVICR